MINTNKRTRLVALIAGTTLLALTSCSSAGSSTSPSADPSGSSSSTASAIPDTSSIRASVTEDKTLAAGVPAALMEKGKLSVGSYIASPPNSFYGPDGTTPVGFEVDLMSAIGSKLGLDIAYQDMSFDSIISSLQSGRVDVTISQMNDTKERQKKIDFVDYFQSGISIMVQAGNPQKVAGPDDLCGKKVAVVTGTSQEEFTKQQTSKCVGSGKAGLEVTATDSFPQNQTQLRTARVDAILIDLPNAVYTAQTVGGGKLFEVVDQAPINGAPYGIGVAKENSALTTSIQNALQGLIDDGTYGKILSSWEVSRGSVKQAVVNGG